jgi:hypothetical protein
LEPGQDRKETTVARLLLCVVLVIAVPACVFAQRPPAVVIVTKDVDFFWAPCGYTITYTITVESNTSVPLYLDYVSDTVFGDISASFSSTLPAFESESAALPYTLQCDDPSPLPNVVEFAYHDDAGGSYVSSAQTSVGILHPMLEAFYECPIPPPPPGEEVPIHFTVRNVGDVDLEVTVEYPPGVPSSFFLAMGAECAFEVEVPCVGDMACVQFNAIGILPPQWGIDDFETVVVLDACCPCNGSPVEESSWGVIKALYRG